ncbi:MAG: RtcB family protein, partial [Rickettsiales bacterium]|nr:RtcB family protein [Rickettsiales bacterium]
MKKLFEETFGNKILSWCEDIENFALEQIKNVAMHPWVKHVRQMPDTHAGMGICIGSVVAWEQAICPNAVGVDIGCGMSAIKTSLNIKNF